MGENHFATIPVAVYAFCLLMCAVAFTILSRAFIAPQAPQSKLAIAVDKDYKGKSSIAIYVVAIALAFVSNWLSLGLVAGVASLWFIPDSRIEKSDAA